MAGLLRVSEENTAARYEYRARISTLLTRKRPPSRLMIKTLNYNGNPQSFQLGLPRPGQRRTRLTVFTPRRLVLLAGTHNTSVQTIPSKQETL